MLVTRVICIPKVPNVNLYLPHKSPAIFLAEGALGVEATHNGVPTV